MARKRMIYDESILAYYFKNSKMKAKGPYINEKMEGEWRFYRDTEQLWQIGHFEKGENHGVWRRHDRKGNVEYENTF